MGSPRHEDIEDLLLGRSTQMDRVRQLAARAAAVDVPVLITGETGTGKSLVARLIHLSGDRRSAPLVPINCSGIPDGLFESEFFRHRRGAFTGAVENRRGLFELANGGTLFMDEVAELPTHQQAKLLTVLEDHEVRRVGDERTRPLDVRILSATSRDLSEAVPSGRFRADLFHRIGVLRIAISPLRERPGDVLLLADRILRDLAHKYATPGAGLTSEARASLAAHTWPGNVRELAHVLEVALICNGDARLGVRDVEEAIAGLPAGQTRQARESGPAGVSVQADDCTPTGTDGHTEVAGDHLSPGTVDSMSTGIRDGAPAGGRDSTSTGTRDHMSVGTDEAELAGPEAGHRGRARYSFYGPSGAERDLIQATLERCGGNKTRAAQELGMARNTLRRKVREHGL